MVDDKAARARAHRCLELAQHAAHESDRARWIAMAQLWFDRAENASKAPAGAGWDLTVALID